MKIMRRMPHLPSLCSGLAAILAVLFLAVGGNLEAQPVAGQSPPEAKPSRRFLVEPGQSEITVRLFKKGLLSGFAHDHVLVGNELSGEILLVGGDVPAATARLTLPVESFQVDLPAHRKREKIDGDLNQDERKEIRKTMLGSKQLHAAKYPNITAVVESVEGRLPLITAKALIRIRDREKQISIPLKAELNGGLLIASGNFAALHSDFAIEPFSSFLGAVAVQDQFQVRLHIQAREMR